MRVTNAQAPSAAQRRFVNDLVLERELDYIAQRDALEELETGDKRSVSRMINWLLGQPYRAGHGPERWQHEGATGGTFAPDGTQLASGSGDAAGDTEYDETDRPGALDRERRGVATEEDIELLQEAQSRASEEAHLVVRTPLTGGGAMIEDGINPPRFEKPDDPDPNSIAALQRGLKGE